MIWRGFVLALGFSLFAWGIYLNHAPIHQALQLIWSY